MPNERGLRVVVHTLVPPATTALRPLNHCPNVTSSFWPLHRPSQHYHVPLPAMAAYRYLLHTDGQVRARRGAGPGTEPSAHSRTPAFGALTLQHT